MPLCTTVDRAPSSQDFQLINPTAPPPHPLALYGWLAAFAAFLSMAVSVGSSQYAFGLFIEPLQAEFGWTRTQISTALSFTAVGSLIAPWLGRLMDRHGARPVMVGSLACFAVSFLLRPLMSELWHWYALSFLQYLGFAGATVLPVGRLVGLWFSRTRGRMMGLTSTGPNVGGLVLPPLVAVALVHGTWQQRYLMLGVLTALVGLFALVVVREPPDSASQTSHRGATAVPARPTANAETAPVAPDTAVGTREWTPREATRTRSFYAITAATMLACFTYATVLPHVLPHLTSHGVALTDASLALGMLATAGIAGKLAFGFLAERITARRAFIVDSLGQAVSVLLVARYGAGELMWVLVPAYGFFMGGCGVSVQLVVQEAFGVRAYGAISGLINLTTIFSFALGPLIAGLSYDATGSYATAFAWSSGFFFIAAVVLLLVREDAGSRR